MFGAGCEISRAARVAGIIGASLRVNARQLLAAAVACALSPASAHAQTYEVLHSFSGDTGVSPNAGLMQGTDGNFYGTTRAGGTFGLGTVFQINGLGTLTTLHSFMGPDGEFPPGALIQSSDDDFYGTTRYGGTEGRGTVFRIDSSGSLTTIHSFMLGEGEHPEVGLVQGSDGKLYGTTTYGPFDIDYPDSYGTVFRIETSGSLTTLHKFTPDDGQWPVAGLVQGGDGFFYGMTRNGGISGGGGCGTVFRMDSAGSLTTLHTFTGDDGSTPAFALVQGIDGAFYGTTPNWDCTRPPGTYGTVFRINSSGSLTILHRFTGDDGAFPWNGVIQGSDGNFYGTTSGRGSGDPFGTIFRLDSSGTLTTLHRFSGVDGDLPIALIQGSDGALYGTTEIGGNYGAGVVFRLTVPLACFPAVQISGPETVCAGQVTNLSAGGGFSSYQWSTGATSQAVTVAPAVTTIYSVDVTGQHACTSSALKTVTVNPVPLVPSISQAANPDGSVRLTSSTASSYLWSTGATAQSIDVSVSGGYWVTVTNGFGCSATSAVTEVSVTPTGSSVSVTNGDVTTTFSDVSSGGTTTVTPIDPGTAGTLPAGGYSISDLGIAYEIATTATVSGDIVIGFEVPDSVDEVTFNSLRVLHGEGGVLVDRTYFSLEGCAPAPGSPCPAPNFATRTIYARVSSLSPFVLATVGTPSIQTITVPLDPVSVSTQVNVQATFTDPGIHTAVWNWDDGTTSSGVVTESAGHGTVTGSHVYTAAGVYRVTLTVTDEGGVAAERLSPYIVVYDPKGGFVTGGGWIQSPPGAYRASPALTGRANFGFVSKYQRGATVPTGETEFEFRAGNLSFRSTVYQWLVIAGARSQFKGSGRINGAGDYGFLLTAVDGQVNGGGGSDKLRVKIWDKSSGDFVVYDNQIACGNAADDADPCTTLAGGSIVIHR